MDKKNHRRTRFACVLIEQPDFMSPLLPVLLAVFSVHKQKLTGLWPQSWRTRFACVP